MVPSRMWTKFRESVVEHAMDLLMQRQSEIPVAEVDSFATAVDHSSRPNRYATQSEVIQLPTLTWHEWRRRSSRPCDAACSEVCVICTDNKYQCRCHAYCSAVGARIPPWLCWHTALYPSNLSNVTSGTVICGCDVVWPMVIDVTVLRSVEVRANLVVTSWAIVCSMCGSYDLLL